LLTVTNGTYVTAGSPSTNTLPQPSTNGPAAWAANLQATLITNGSSGGSIGGGSGTTNDANGLVAWWPLDDLSGTDVTGDGYTLTFAGGPGFVPGKITNGVAFNGSGQFASTATAPVTAAPLTLTGWFNSSGASGVLFGLFNTTQANWYSYFVTMTSGTIAANSANNNNFAGASSPNTYNDGNWHFAAAVFSASQQVLYVDGMAVQTNSSAQVPTGLNEMCIAAAQRSGVVDNYFNGTLDDVRVYNRALSASEVASQFLWPSVATQ
jgi:uncharacterized membrane protein YphA (DoxX/SURF4 family)